MNTLQPKKPGIESKSHAPQRLIDGDKLLENVIHSALEHVRGSPVDLTCGEMLWPLVRGAAQVLSSGTEIKSVSDVRDCLAKFSADKRSFAPELNYFLPQLLAVLEGKGEQHKFELLERMADTVSSKSGDPRVMVEGILLHLAKNIIGRTSDFNALAPFIYCADEQCRFNVVQFLGNSGTELRRLMQTSSRDNEKCQAALEQITGLLTQISKLEFAGEAGEYAEVLLKQIRVKQ